MNMWKKSGCSMLVILVVGSMGCTLSTDEREVEYDFNDVPTGALPAGWRVAETAGKGKIATWEVIEDTTQSKAVAITENKNEGRTFSLLIAEEKQFKDLEISVKVKAIDGKQDQGGGPMWRVQDSDNYYVCRWNPLEDNLNVYVIIDGARSKIASADVMADPVTWHEIEIKHIGDTIVAKLDGKKLIKITDNAFAAAGKIGLWAKSNAVTAFDDVEAEALDE